MRVGVEVEGRCGFREVMVARHERLSWEEFFAIAGSGEEECGGR